MSVLVILSLCTRAPSIGTGGCGNGSICVTGLSTVHLPSTSLHADSEHIVDGFFVPPVLLFYPPDLERSEYTFCRPRKHSALLFPLPATLRPRIWDSFCSTVLRTLVSPAPSLRLVQILVWASCHAIFRMASDRLNPSGTWTKCSPHVPPTSARSGSLLGVLLACSSPHGT